MNKKFIVRGEQFIEWEEKIIEARTPKEAENLYMEILDKQDLKIRSEHVDVIAEEAS